MLISTAANVSNIDSKQMNLTGETLTELCEAFSTNNVKQKVTS